MGEGVVAPAMARPNQPFFLNRHLATSAAGPSPPPPSPPPSAVITAWSDLRRASSSSTATTTAISAALRTLAYFGPSLHVADAHAHLLLSLPTSPDLLRLLHLWLRRSPNPCCSPILPSLASAAAAAISAPDAGADLLAAGVLLLGAVVAVPGLSEASKTKTQCLELLCGVLERRGVGLAGDHAAELLAGVGYALFAAKDSNFVRVLGGLLGGRAGASRLPLDHGLMILHLMEWIVSSSIDSGSYEKVRIACVELSKYHEMKYPEHVVVMAAAGILRGLNGNNTVRVATDLRSLVEGTIVSIAMDLVTRAEKFDLGVYGDDDDNNSDKVLLQFVALGLARSGPCSFHPSLVVCLAVSLMAEVFPLPIYYRRAIGNSLAVEEFLKDS